MTTDSRDPLARFLAFLGEVGEAPDFAAQVDTLKVPPAVRRALLARDAEALRVAVGSGDRAIPFVRTAQEP